MGVNYVHVMSQEEVSNFNAEVDKWWSRLYYGKRWAIKEFIQRLDDCEKFEGLEKNG